MLRQQTDQLHQDIANLYLQFPELKDDEELRLDTIEGATDLKELATAIVRAIGDARGLCNDAVLRMEELWTRKKRFERHGEFLRAMLLKILQDVDVRKLVLAEATLSIRAGQPHLIGDPDPNALPDELCRIKREPDLIKIRDALLRGQDVPGVILSNAEPTLAVYVK